VIHRTSDGPRYFKAWFLADRFVVTRYRDHPQSEPPAEKPAVAWMGVIAEDGRLRVETTVDGGAFTDVCAWLMGETPNAGPAPVTVIRARVRGRDGDARPSPGPPPQRRPA